VGRRSSSAFGFFIFKAFWRNPEVGEDYGGVPAQIHHV
jgi:hypothetical protein